ncbi:MAG: histidine phosphatase family protein [Bacteroidetes bacterium]|nr:histidine phosphatase family protein [Bacteroidota bacterium]
MKSDKRTLYLVRHAKAARMSNQIQDIDRPLHEAGIVEAYEMAELLFQSKDIPQLIISSPAARAMSTALIFQRVLNVPDDKLKVTDKLYEVTLNDLYEVVAELDDKYHSIMLFGHNPSFTQLASKMEPAIIHMSTGSVVRFDFEVEKWRHSSYINAEKKFFVFPK